MRRKPSVSLVLGFPGIEVLLVREKQALPQYARNVPGRYYRVCVINPNGYQGPDLDGTLLAVPLDPSVGESAWVNSYIVPAGAQQAQAPDQMSHRSARREQGTILADQDPVAGAATFRVTYSTNDRQNWSLAALEHTGGNSTVANAGSNLPYIVGVGAGWSGWINSNEVPADGASATDG